VRVVVIGAGVVGTTTAYYLQQMGASVTLIDQATPGSGASEGNGGQLSYSFVAPLADPAIITKIPKWLLQPASPLRFAPRFSLNQWLWIAAFLRACTHARASQTTGQLLQLASRSRTLADSLLADEQIDCSYTQTGKLVLYRDTQSLAAAERQRKLQEAMGCVQHLLSAQECEAREPALKQRQQPLEGGIWTPSECAIDSRALCLGLTSKLIARGVTVVQDTRIVALRRSGNRINAAVSKMGDITGDAFVVAGGAVSNDLTHPLGINLLMEPLKGYSITAALRSDAVGPHISVTDASEKVVFARLGGDLRVAGMAELVGFNPRVDKRRIDQLVHASKQNFGDCAHFGEARSWFGFRPATPTGLPITERTPIDNLYLNTGHGALGVTLSFATSQLVASAIINQRSVTPIATAHDPLAANNKPGNFQ